MAEKPKRVIDRERQWRKVDAGHYTSPKGRFQAARDESGWTLVDTAGELPVEFFARWRDARRFVEDVEFAEPALPPIEFAEDEIVDEFHDTYRVIATRGGEHVFDVVVRRGVVIPPRLDSMRLDEAEALATALVLATHRAAQMTRKEA